MAFDLAYPVRAGRPYVGQHPPIGLAKACCIGGFTCVAERVGFNRPGRYLLKYLIKVL